jgi:hypothetical protein
LFGSFPGCARYLIKIPRRKNEFDDGEVFCFDFGCLEGKFIAESHFLSLRFCQNQYDLEDWQQNCRFGSHYTINVSLHVYESNRAMNIVPFYCIFSAARNNVEGKVEFINNLALLDGV